MCLFSSYLGGKSANRGLCKQPCRRMYQTDKGQIYPFNLKDNQQLENLDELKNVNISSLKIEGRLKSAEYVWRVARAYRFALDNPQRKDEAAQMLELDLGREKTSYFTGGDLSRVFSNDTYTGQWLGKIIQTGKNHIEVSSDLELNTGNRLRIRPKNSKEKYPVKIENVTKTGDKHFQIQGKIPPEVNIGDHIYLTDLRDMKFSSTLDSSQVKLPQPISGSKISQILKSLKTQPSKHNKEQVFVRIDSIKWLKKVYIPAVSGLILNLSKSGWEKFKPDAGFILKNQKKIYIELPGFISEKHIEFYKNLIRKLSAAGYQNFSLSHLSQKELFDKRLNFLANENIYALNDAAIYHFKQEENIHDFIFPLENDFENLKNSYYKNGIVPVYFSPSLFYSRMPSKVREFTSDQGEHFYRQFKDGITHIYPDKPVSLLQFADKLHQEGYRRFLLDMTFEKPSGHRMETLLKRLKNSTQVQPSTNFNFIKGLT